MRVAKAEEAASEESVARLLAEVCVDRVVPPPPPGGGGCDSVSEAEGEWSGLWRGVCRGEVGAE